MLGRRASQTTKRADRSLVRDPSDGRKVVLHVGCGTPHPERLHPSFRGSEWREVRLDIEPRVQPEIVANMVEMPVVPTESVDAVWSSHNLEHVYAYEVPNVLAEFFRVLRPAGGVLIMLPDIQVAAQSIAAGKIDDPIYEAPGGAIVSPLDMVFGHTRSIEHGHEAMAHRTGFTARSLKAKLVEADFVDARVERVDWELRASARKPSDRLDAARLSAAAW